MEAAQRLKEMFGGEPVVDRGQETVVVPRQKAVEALTFLRDECGFDGFVDLTAVDLQGRGAPGRFAVVYSLYSYPNRRRIRLKAFLPGDDPTIDSACGVFPGADWAEREVYDLFGIRFKGHPGLKRIQLPEWFEHHPLRKDYPIEGLGERDRFERYYR